MHTVIIILARMQTQPLFGKPLADLGRVPVLARVTQQALGTRCATAVFVTNQDALNKASRGHPVA